MSDIKIITEPSVYVVGVQAIDNAELARFLTDNGCPDWQTDATGAGETLVELGGRLCYQSFGKPRPGGHQAYIQHILEAGHGSVTEHAVFNLILTGVSRSLTHELVRHRAGWGFSQLSQRYVDESDVAFVVPPAYMDAVRVAMAFYEKYENKYHFDSYNDAYDRAWVESQNAENLAIMVGLRWLRSMERSLDAYGFFSDYGLENMSAIDDKTARRKQAREAARSVLPNCTETKIFATANARALRNLFEQRGSAGADAEIRRLSIAVLRAVKPMAPDLFADCIEVDGCITVQYHKV